MDRSFGSLLALIALAGLGCGPPPAGGIYYASGRGSVTPEGLHRIEWEPFRATYVKPGADFRRYDKVLIQSLTISYEDPPRSRPHTLSHRRPVVANYALPDSNIRSMMDIFQAAFEKSLRKSANFSVTDDPGPEVLLLVARVVDLQVTAPPSRYQPAGEPYWTSSPGKMTLVLDAVDSLSNEPLLKIGERREIDFNDGGLYQSDAVSSTGALQQIFASWADRLRHELDQLHSLPQLPPAPRS